MIAQLILLIDCFMEEHNMSIRKHWTVRPNAIASYISVDDQTDVEKSTRVLINFDSRLDFLNLCRAQKYTINQCS